MFRISFILVLTLLAGSVSAQPSAGIKAGLNLADIVMTNYVNPDVESDLTVKAGLHAGVFLILPIEKRVGFTGELQYSNKGVSSNSRINLHYITVPLLAQYALQNDIVLEVGPELSYMMAATSDYGSEVGSYNDKFDLALNGGIRFDLDRWILGLRYSAGLFSVRDRVVGGSTPDRVKYQNRVLQFSLGYKLFRFDTSE